MQTQYTLLYRYVNPNTNTPVTGQSSYEKTEEFYSHEHKLNITEKQITDFKNSGYNLKGLYNGETEANLTATLKNEATEEREELIRSNMTNEDKSNNLFIYTGTKKIFHKKYIPEQLGYVVRDWTKVPKDQVPSSPDDFSKHFVMLGGSKLGFDNAYLVCKPQYINTYMKKQVIAGTAKCFADISTLDLTNKGYKSNSEFYHQYGLFFKNLQNAMEEITFFKIASASDSIEYGEMVPTGVGGITQADSNGIEYLLVSHVHQAGGSTPTTHLYYPMFFSNSLNNNVKPSLAGVNTTNFTISAGGTTDRYVGYKLTDLASKGYNNFGDQLIIDQRNVIRDTIPAHYEETGKHPYYIKDQYQKIELSPWILHSIHNSLESGLNRAKELVSMVGINNVKLIKTVPFNQFIKIK